MSQETSIQAYMSIQNELGDRQEEVYKALRTLNDATNRELSDYLSLPINQITPRTNELVKMDVVINVGRKMDTKTKRNVMIWKAL